MYRQYENPRELEKLLESKRTSLAMLRARMQFHNIDDISTQELEEMSIDLQMQISELEERVNFAWQDEEFEENCARYGY